MWKEVNRDFVIRMERGQGITKVRRIKGVVCSMQT